MKNNKLPLHCPWFTPRCDFETDNPSVLADHIADHQYPFGKNQYLSEIIAKLISEKQEPSISVKKIEEKIAELDKRYHELQYYENYNLVESCHISGAIKELKILLPKEDNL